MVLLFICAGDFFSSPDTNVHCKVIKYLYDILLIYLCLMFSVININDSIITHDNVGLNPAHVFAPVVSYLLSVCPMSNVYSPFILLQSNPFIIILRMC